MKKETILRTLIIFITTCVISNVVAQSHLPNPERGFRYEEMALLPSLQFPWDSNRTLNTQNWFNVYDSNFGGTDGHIKVSQLYIYLTQFASTDIINQSALNALQDIFNGVRNQGRKLVIQFVYTYDGTGGYVYPPMSRILNHLDQLKSIIKNNIDVIHLLELGGIGLWGEWHNYNNAYNQADKTALIRKMLEILPQNRNVTVRLPEYKNSAGLTPDEYARVGFANLFFTDNQHPHALDWGYLGSAINYQVSSESNNLQIDGEMPYTGTTADYLGYVLDPIQSIKQFMDQHYTTFSVVHNYDLTIANWKSTNLSKSQMDQNGFPYDPNYFNNGSRTVYDYVADHLGYRLFLDYLNSNVSDKGDHINCDIQIKNYGFSAIHNPREVFLVLTDFNNVLVDLVKTDANPSNWQTGVSNSIKGTLIKPIGLTNYKLGIWLPDFEGSLSRFDSRYAIRFCNTKWLEIDYSSGKKLGLNQIDLISTGSVDPGDDFCRSKGGANAQDRYITKIETTGALKNITSYNATEYPIDGYSIYSSEVINVPINGSFLLKMTNSPNTKWSRVIAWVDWNGDHTFNTSTEEVFHLGNAGSDNSNTVLNISQNINVPSNSTAGIKRVRIRFYDAWMPNPGPCGIVASTTTYDFLVEVYDLTAAPIYCSATGSSTPNDRYIQSLTTTGGVSNINFTNSSFPANAYMSHTATKVEVAQGSTFTLNMANSANTKWSRIKCWIDWNHNGVFDDPGEEVFYLGNASSDNSATVLNISKLITVPTNATIGTTGMRVRFHDAWLPNSGPCGNVASTTTFDFQVKIDDGSNIVPTYCSSTGSSTPNDRYIQSLTTTGGVSNINVTNSSFPANAYMSHTATKVEVAQGSTFTLNMANSVNTKWSRIKCWIDWNHNGVFDDPGEEVFYLGIASSDNSATVLNISKLITVPTNATIGTTGMRVRFHDAWLPNPGSCGNVANTTTFDFQVKIDASQLQLTKLATNLGLINGIRDVKIYPNPATESITIFSDTEINNLLIYSMMGKEIKCVKNVNATNIRIDISSLRQGVYLFQVEDRETHVYHYAKFVKE